MSYGADNTSIAFFGQEGLLHALLGLQLVSSFCLLLLAAFRLLLILLGLGCLSRCFLLPALGFFFFLHVQHETAFAM